MQRCYSLAYCIASSTIYIYIYRQVKAAVSLLCVPLLCASSLATCKWTKVTGAYGDGHYLARVHPRTNKEHLASNTVINGVAIDWRRR